MRGRRVGIAVLLAALFAAGLAASLVATRASAASAGKPSKWRPGTSAKHAMAGAFKKKHHRKKLPRLTKAVAVRSGNNFYALAWIAKAKGQPEMFFGRLPGASTPNAHVAAASAPTSWTDRGASNGKPCNFGSSAVVKLLGYAKACGLTSGTGTTTTTVGAASTVVSDTSFPMNPDWAHPVQWSQGGTHLVWIDGSHDIESVPAGGGAETAIASNNNNGSMRNSFAVSPDGSQIAYDDMDFSRCYGGICVETIASNGSGSPVLTYGGANPQSTSGDNLAWSSNSADVYFSDYDSGDGESWVAEVPAGGGAATEVTPAVGGPGTIDSEMPLAVGSNGNLLYDHVTSSGNDDVVFLSGGGTFDTGADYAALSPDGSKVATDDRGVLTVEGVGGTGAVTTGGSNASFSSDGSKLAYSDSQGTWVVNTDLSSLRQVSTTPCVSPIAWSPDDSALACQISSTAIGTMPVS